MPLSAQSIVSSLNHNFHSYETTKSLTNLNNQNISSYISFSTVPDTLNDTIDCPSPEQLQYIKRNKEKCNVLKEILSSEKKYINDIREIVEGYYDEIFKSYEENQEFIYHIFSNIREIFEFTKSFYSMLEVASIKDECAISLCFIKKQRMFSKLYSTYCNNYKIAHSTIERLEKDNTIGKIIQRVRNKYGHSLKMATYLQLPVLRITKYHLLLQRYLKLQDKDSNEYKYILEALEVMRSVNDQINRDMPEFDEIKNDNSNISKENKDGSKNLTTLNLTTLFGPVLKQGNIISTETGYSHHTVVFQTMFLIRETDSNSRIINTITNDCLGFSPITVNSGHKNWKKCFSVIDYNQNKCSENMLQLTFRTNSSDEKKSWQSAIVSCMLNGYGKKISENIKKKVMRIDQDVSYIPKYESIRNRISNIKRIKDFRYSYKNDYKNTSIQNFEDLNNSRYRNKTKDGKDSDPNMTAPLSKFEISLPQEILNDSYNINNNKSKISDTFKSPIFNILSKKENQTSKKSLLDTTTRSENALQNVLKRFYRPNSSKKKLNLTSVEGNSSLMSESCIFNDSSLNLPNSQKISEKSCVNSSNIGKKKDKKKTELKLNDFEIIYQHMDTSFVLKENSNFLDETTVSKFEKFINKKIATSGPLTHKNMNKKNKSDIIIGKKEFIDGDSGQIEVSSPKIENRMVNQNTNIEIYESSLSSKSSITSEEGYYSNHESSVSTLINEIQTDECLKKYNLPKTTNKTNTNQIVSTPESQCKYSDISSDQFSNNSSDLSSKTSEKGIIHVEIINNFDTSSDFEPINVYNSSCSSSSSSSSPEPQISPNPHLENKDNIELMKIQNDEIILNSGNHAISSFNKMEKFRYKKKLSLEKTSNKSVNDLKMKFNKDIIQSDSLKTTSGLPSIKLNKQSSFINYEKFSRNLNSSLTSLYDNNDYNSEYDEGNESLAYHSLIQNSTTLPNPNILSKSILHAAHLLENSYIKKTPPSVKMTSPRFVSLGSLLENDQKNNNNESFDDSAESQFNVKDLISKFETQKKIISKKIIFNNLI